MKGAISRGFGCDASVTNDDSGVGEVVQRRAGGGEDVAHLFIAAARAMEVQESYVSGYIHVPGVGGVMEGA